MKKNQKDFICSLSLTPLINFIIYAETEESKFCGCGGHRNKIFVIFDQKNPRIRHFLGTNLNFQPSSNLRYKNFQNLNLNIENHIAKCPSFSEKMAYFAALTSNSSPTSKKF